MEKFKPLQGYRVIDMSIYAAGPICSMTLADWGADVIKVESLSGDAFRTFGLLMNCNVAEDDNIQFELDNRNKRGIALDLKTEKGKQIFHKLLKTSDVIVTNFRPKALAQLKLSYDDLKSKYPGLVYAVLNGYGDKGPEKDKPGFDVAAYWAKGGILAEFGEPDSDPIPALAGVGDHPTGSLLAGGICAALLRKERTGKGCKVQTSLYNSALWTVSLNIAEANNTGVYKKRTNKIPPTGLMNTYKTKDNRWITIMCLEYERYWQSFCDVVLEKPFLIDDQRFNTLAATKKNSRALAEIIKEDFLKIPLDELVRRLKMIDIVYEVNLRFHEIKDDPQALENGYVIPFSLPSGRIDWTIGNPVQFSGQSTEIVRLAPKLGEHNVEILSELGHTSEEIASLRKENVVL